MASCALGKAAVEDYKPLFVLTQHFQKVGFCLIIDGGHFRYRENEIQGARNVRLFITVFEGHRVYDEHVLLLIHPALQFSRANNFITAPLNLTMESYSYL